MWVIGKKAYENLKKTLEAENYNVVNILNSFSALETVSEERPDLILLDTAFLDTDGFEICRQLRANPKYRWVPVMMLGEKNEAEDSIKAYKSGADDYITAPLNPLELRARVGMILRRSRV
ncbi:response regulator [Methanosarcina horonobensis]|uniref:response regulator n=1 Tax=Methanosarcina horonobensis TaxID=418008 RepID=UPI000B0ADBCC|nr:response regulator [Methanosarcina horonobensis]